MPASSAPGDGQSEPYPSFVVGAPVAGKWVWPLKDPHEEMVCDHEVRKNDQRKGGREARGCGHFQPQRSHICPRAPTPPPNSSLSSLWGSCDFTWHWLLPGRDSSHNVLGLLVECQDGILRWNAGALDSTSHSPIAEARPVHPIGLEPVCHFSWSLSSRLLSDPEYWQPPSSNRWC